MLQGVLLQIVPYILKNLPLYFKNNPFFRKYIRTLYLKDASSPESRKIRNFDLLYLTESRL